MDSCLKLIKPFNNNGLVQKMIGPCWNCIDQPLLKDDALTQEDKNFIKTVNSMTPLIINTHHRFRYHWGIFSPSLQEIVSSMLHFHPVEYWIQYHIIYVTIQSFKINDDGSGYTGTGILYPVKKETPFIKQKQTSLKRKQENYNESVCEPTIIESSYIDRPDKRQRY
jgi:hypothetical protein